MVLRATSSNLSEAREPRDENLLQEEEGNDGRFPQGKGMRDVPAGPRDLGEKVVAADIALDWVLQEIAQQARLATGATGAFVSLVRTNKIVCQATSGSTAGEFVTYLKRERRMIDACLRTGLQRCRDSEVSAELDVSVCRYLGARAILIVPILDEKEERIGILGVFSPQVDAFSNASIVSLQSLSHRVADAISQVDRCTSVSSADVSAPTRSSRGRFLPIRAPLLQATLRSLAAAGRASSVWIIGISAVVLLVGWTVSRAISQRGMHTPVSVSAAVTSNTNSLPARPLSNDANTKPAQKPAVTADVKPVADAPIVHKANNKISSRLKPHMPDLEIENALDDVSSEPRPSESAGTISNKETSPLASPLRVPERFALDHLAERVKPDYPADLKAQHVQGTVVLDVVVNQDGRVEMVNLVDGDSRLVVAATMAVGRWRFTPLLRDGHPVSFESHITLHFALP